MEKMERVLAMWIEDLNRTRMPVSQAIIQQTAKSLYDDLKMESESSVSAAMAKETFTAVRGWFDRFMCVYGQDGLKVHTVKPGVPSVSIS